MRIHDHTLNTGNHTVHDAAASILDDAALPLAALVAAGSGDVPGAPGVTYLLAKDCTALTTYGPMGPIWTAIIYRTADQGEHALAELQHMARSLNLRTKPIRPAAPGLITLLYPGATAVPPATIHMLADFAKAMAITSLQGH